MSAFDETGMSGIRDERGLMEALLGDGHFLLALTGVA